MTSSPSTALTDRYGFPVETCGRCGGTGSHSYNQLHGSRCYGCNGAKVRHTRKAGKQFKAWADAVRALRQAKAVDVQPGDELAILDFTGPFCPGKLRGWHSVVSVVINYERAIGWTHKRTDNGAELKIPTMWAATVTFDDGEVEQTSTANTFRRRGWIDPAEYVARAR